MTSNPSLSWQKMQDVYYSLQSCYDTLSWSIGNLHADYKVKISTYTTVVALCSKYAPYPSVIDIYTVSGTKLWSIVYNSTAAEHIIDYEFKNEHLYVILTGQKYRHYRDLKGTFDEYSFTKDLILLDNFGDTNTFTRGVELDESDGFSPQRHVISNLETDETEEVFNVLNTYIWGEYLFLRLTNRFIIVDLGSGKNFEVPISESLSSKMNCISLLQLTEAGLSVVISFDTTVVTLKIDLGSSSYEIIDHGLTDGPFTKVTASPNGQLIAFLNEEASTIFVINNTFSQVLLEYDTSNDSSLPYQIEWCGNDAIVLSLRDEIKVVGPKQASISFFYDQIEEDESDFDAVLKGSDELSFTIAFLKTEPDGLKILTTKKLEFLSRVPEPSRQLYQIGSSHPGTILLDCIDKLSQQSSKADTNISLLKSDGTLNAAMDLCLDAALDEFSSHWQKKILSSVAFGKAYVDGFYDAEKYLNVINSIKVLNQLRSADVALFLTYGESETIGWENIISMLLNREQYLLALKVIELLDLRSLKDSIFIHWCCYKIKKEIDMEDEQLYKIVSQKLFAARDAVDGAKNYISTQKIADIAYEEGRLDLCNSLINLEPSIVKKIEQHLKYDKLEIALIKAFESGKYDLSKLILMHLHDTVSMSQFFKILHQNESTTVVDPFNGTNGTSSANGQNSDKKGLFVSGELVENFWVQNIGIHDQHLLEKYYKEEDMRVELALDKLKVFLENDESKGSESYYDDYRSHLLKLASHSGDRKNTKFYQQSLEVLGLQQKLSETYRTDFFKTSTLTEILVKLISMHQLKQAYKVVKEFKLTTEKLWNLVLQTYCKAREFDRLHEFIVSSSPDRNNLRSPIGFLVIVETCLAYKGPAENISAYINSCTDMHYLDKIQLFISNNDLVAAAQEAYKYRDVEFMRSILKRANKHANESVIQSIKTLLFKLE